MRPTLKVDGAALIDPSPWVLNLGQQGIEPAGLVERIKVVAAAHMGGADEDLRKGILPVGALDHLLTDVPFAGGVNLLEAYALLGKQFLRGVAIGAVADGVDVDSSH